MTDFGRRDFLKGAVAGSVATTGPLVAEAQAQTPVAAPASAAAPPAVPGYAYLNLEEAAFVEALVDHMVPADELTPKGTDIGINVYIDRALARRLGQGRATLHAGAVEAGRAEPGLSASAHARAALSRRHRGDQRVLPQDLRQAFRPARRDSSARRFSSASTGKVNFEAARRRASFLTHALSDRHGRHVLRPDLRRQSQQGRLEADRLSRRHRGASREHREISRTRNSPHNPLGIADMS